MVERREWIGHMTCHRWGQASLEYVLGMVIVMLLLLWAAEPSGPIQGGFTVDTLSINAYFDGFAFGQASVQATILYDLLFFSISEPEGVTCAQLADEVLDRLCSDFEASPPTSVAELQAAANQIAQEALEGVSLINDGSPESASPEACLAHILDVIQSLLN